MAIVVVAIVNVPCISSSAAVSRVSRSEVVPCKAEKLFKYVKLCFLRNWIQIEVATPSIENHLPVISVSAAEILVS